MGTGLARQERGRSARNGLVLAGVLWTIQRSRAADALAAQRAARLSRWSAAFRRQKQGSR